MITMEALQSAIQLRIDNYNINDWPLQKRVITTCELLNSRNQILAQEIVSSFDVPRQNVSAMDGYAIAQGSDLSKESVIDIVGESQAGSAYIGELTAGQGVRIFTGAVVPDNCDTVIMQENTNFADIKDTLDKSQPYAI
ncbi:MAG: molybdopterin molybdenumtransferase MoeA, partial [Psychrobacter sp.]|nr:molybdopterin molybdenumtransferase MoeA [Psychrobacter sp.]